jgi:tetratricopeptide (TPR) repeat protein
MLRQALAIDRKNEDPAGIETRGYLARILLRRGSYPEAIALLREAIEILGRTQGPDSPDSLLMVHDLAATSIDYKGDLIDAEKSKRQVLEVRRRISPDHPDTACSLNSLSWILLEEGNWQAAEPFLKKTLENYSKPGGAATDLPSRRTIGDIFSRRKVTTPESRLHTVQP